MRWASVVAAAAVVVLSVAALAGAAVRTPPDELAGAPARFVIEGTVAQASGGSLDLSVTRVVTGAISADQQITISEGPRTSVWESGRQVPMTAVAAGDLVRVSGEIDRSGASPMYEATAVTIEQ